MRLHLLRHAIPVSRDEASVSDAERELNQEGRVQVRRVAQGLERLDLRPDLIVTSPFVRARQTAELASNVLGFRGELRVLRELRPESDPQDTREALLKLQPANDVIVVGHKPHFPRFVAALLTGDPEGLDARLGKASLCTIDLAVGTPEALGRIERLIQADELARLGGS